MQVKWALGSITTNKASGRDGIPAELFQIQKDDAMKVLHSIYQQIWKTQQWPQHWKMSVFIPIPKKGNIKKCSKSAQFHSPHTLAKRCSKILQARLQQYVNQEFPKAQAGFRRGRGTRVQINNMCWVTEKAKEFYQNIHFCFIDYLKTFDYIIVFQLLSHVQLFETPAAEVRLLCPSLSPWVCSNSCPLRQWSHPIISSSVIPLSFCPQSSPASGSFQIVSSLHQVAKVLKLQLQYLSFQWIFRTDYL